MEVWSRYNYILNSDKIGGFIYNARTNSFTKINDSILQIISKENKNLQLLKDNVKEKFKELKIIVEENEDEDYFYNKKFLKYLDAFSNDYLSLTIATTTLCNFRCPYCYEEGATKATLNKELDDLIIKFIKNNNAKCVGITWYGGEPLLNFKSIKYITEILGNRFDNKKIDYTIVTNGYLLDKEKVDFFKKYKISSIQVTLDGLKEDNDKTRILSSGKGSFDTIIKNLDYIMETLPNCKIKIRVNTDKNNIDNYPPLYNFLKERYVNKENLFIYHGFILNHTEKLNNCIQIDEMHVYNKRLVEKYDIIDFDIYPEFQIGLCTANSLNSFVIDPEGNLCKCWLDIGKPDRIIGTIKEAGNNKYAYNLLSKYMTYADIFDNVKCRNCFFLPNCDGGCPHQRI